MYLIQLFLPLYDNEGKAFPKSMYDGVREVLVERFHGLTAYARAPASGLWQEEDGVTVRDDLVIYEVMGETLDGDWWRSQRRTWESNFMQDSILVRAQEIQLL